MKARSVLAGLAAAPKRFRFDAAVRVLTRARRSADPAEVMRFRTPTGLVFPPADILELDARGPQPELTVGLMGLTGPSGVLPRAYTEIVTQTRRGRSTALHEFLDMLGHRFVAFFARAAMKYRPARAAETAALRAPGAADPVTQTLLALTGYGTAHLTPRLLAGTDPILHYAGLFAMRPRSADRLGAMLSDWLGMRVEVQEFAGAWLGLPVDQRTRIGVNGQFNRLAMRRGDRGARLGSAGAFRAARRAAGPRRVRAAVARPAGAASAGIADPGLCRVRAGLCRQSGADGAAGAAAAA